MIDPYVYEGTDVLINKFSITDYQELNKLENELTIINIKNILDNSVKIDGLFDYNHLMNYHKYIFGDIYEWAGKQRTIGLEKSEIVLNGLMLVHTDVQNIEGKINKALEQMNRVKWNEIDFSKKVDCFSKALSEVWMAHAFREGNTRTSITFFLKYAEEHGFALNNELITNNIKYVRDSLVASAYSDADLGIKANFTYLKRIIEDAMALEKPNVKRKSLKDIKAKVFEQKVDNKYKIGDKNLEKER